MQKTIETLLANNPDPAIELTEEFRDLRIAVGVLACVLICLDYLVPVPFPDNYDFILTAHLKGHDPRKKAP